MHKLNLNSTYIGSRHILYSNDILNIKLKGNYQEVQIFSIGNIKNMFFLAKHLIFTKNSRYFLSENVSSILFGTSRNQVNRNLYTVILRTTTKTTGNKHFYSITELKQNEKII